MRLACCAAVNLGGWRARAASATPGRGWFESRSLNIHAAFSWCGLLVGQGSRGDTICELTVLVHVYNVCYSGDSFNDAKLL